jgi:hypothetical protein
MAGRKTNAIRSVGSLLGFIVFAALLSYATIARWRDREAVRADISLFWVWATTRAVGAIATPISASTTEKQGWISVESESRYEFKTRSGERFALVARAKSGSSRMLKSVTLIFEGRTVEVPVDVVYEGRPIDLIRMLSR